MSNHPSKHLKMLNRRADFLERRLQNIDKSRSSYDRSELQALRWAIANLDHLIN